MRTRKAFLLAPMAALAVIYLWTIAHFELPYAAIALVHPFIWVFALAYGLPALAAPPRCSTHDDRGRGRRRAASSLRNELRLN